MCKNMVSEGGGGDIKEKSTSNQDPREMVGRIYEADLEELQLTKCVSSRSHGFKRRIFLKICSYTALYQ